MRGIALLRVSAAFFLLPHICGCVLLVPGVIGGVGTAVWLSGKLTQEANVKLSKAVDAVESGLNSLKLVPVRESVKKNAAVIRGNYYDGQSIWIDVHRLSDKRSRIEVRVGVKGDKEAARKIMDAIIRRI